MWPTVSLFQKSYNFSYILITIMGNQLLIYSGGSYRDYKDPDPVKEVTAQERGCMFIHVADFTFYYITVLK